jgi:hypothetical protein
MWLLILSLLMQDDELSPLPTIKLTVQPTLQFISMRAKADELRDDGTYLPSAYIVSDNFEDAFDTLDALPELFFQLNFMGWGVEAYHADMRQRFDDRLGTLQNYDDHPFPAGPYEFDYLIRRYRAGLLIPPFGGPRMQLRLGLGIEIMRLEFGLHAPPPDEQVESSNSLMAYLQAELRIALAPALELAALARGGGQPWETDYPDEGGTGYFFEIEARAVYFLARFVSIEVGPRLLVARIEFDGREDSGTWGVNNIYAVSFGLFVALSLRF